MVNAFQYTNKDSNSQYFIPKAKRKKFQSNTKRWYDTYSVKKIFYRINGSWIVSPFSQKRLENFIMTRFNFLFPIVLIVFLFGGLPIRAQEEFQEAIQQTEDEWNAVRSTLKESGEKYDSFLEKYNEYHDAVFSGSPEEGIELARKLFNLDRNQVFEAENKVAELRKMFTKIDNAGLSEKLKAASGYLDKANSYAGEVEGMWEFTKKFDPEHAKDNPTYGLRLIGSLLTESADKMGKIPLVGQILGPWVKAYGEVAVDFSNALDKLTAKIDKFRGGSLCGQLGKRQYQQEAFKAAGGNNCLTYFASGIFPKLRGETYEGDEDYFLYDPSSKRGYIASPQAYMVYQWSTRLLEKRALYPDWLANRANSLKQETIDQARESYFLFRGWKTKSELDWLIIEKLGLYNDAYFYGMLDEQTFIANYILTQKHRSAINAILKEYNKYLLVRGTIYEEIGDSKRRSSGSEVIFTIETESFSEITKNDGTYEILIKGNVNDFMKDKVSKFEFVTIKSEGRITEKVISGMNYTLSKSETSEPESTNDLEENEPRWILDGSLYVSDDYEGEHRITKAHVGQEVYFQVQVGASGLGRSETVEIDLEVLLPGGQKVLLHPSGVMIRPLQLTGFKTAASFLLEDNMLPGICRVTGNMILDNISIPIEETDFEIEASEFQVGELKISPLENSNSEAMKYAVGDMVFLKIDVAGVASGMESHVSSEWNVSLPDGRNATPQQTALVLAENKSGSFTNSVSTNENLPLGIYRVEVIINDREGEIARRMGVFELVPLFENPILKITNLEGDNQAVQNFRPADPIYFLLKMIYNSVNPNREVHVSVDINGPDINIRGLGIEAAQTFLQGSQNVGVSRQIPGQILEGIYNVTITLDGGFNQYLSLQDTFNIVYPVQFDGIWTRDRSQPPSVKRRFTGNDEYEWLMGYRFVDTRLGDQYSSAIWCHIDNNQISFMSSDRLGPDTPYPGRATTTFTGLIPYDMPSATYSVNGVVWYNDIAYYSSGTSLKIGQEPTIVITSPQSGFEVDKKVMVVTGTCADKNLTQAKMYTNGEAISIKLKDGAFSAKTVLRPGQNQIRVVAENELTTSEASVWGTANINAAALKIVLTWEASGTDIDLWVTDPEGILTNYTKKKPAEGRNLDVDDRSGPGMETYTIETPLRGNYQVAVHYFADSGFTGTVPFQLQITSWETTYNESRSGTSGTLYKAAKNREEQGAVVYFTIPLY